jgi:hypothetical protein
MKRSRSQRIIRLPSCVLLGTLRTLSLVTHSDVTGVVPEVGEASDQPHPTRWRARSELRTSPGDANASVIGPQVRKPGPQIRRAPLGLRSAAEATRTIILVPTCSHPMAAIVP